MKSRRGHDVTTLWNPHGREYQVMGKYCASMDAGDLRLQLERVGLVVR